MRVLRLCIWLFGLVAWFSLRVREVPGSIPGTVHSACPCSNPFCADLGKRGEALRDGQRSAMETQWRTEALEAPRGFAAWVCAPCFESQDTLAERSKALA